MIQHGDIALVAISTHAPAGGATERKRARAALRSDFYSRPCGRGDITNLLLAGVDVKISTHAPAGGATHQGAHLHPICE